MQVIGSHLYVLAGGDCVHRQQQQFLYAFGFKRIELDALEQPRLLLRIYD